MPLLSIFESDPDSVSKFSIEQVVSAAGDGVLRDQSTCSKELGEYLGKIPTQTIARYVDHCLSTAFQKSGMILQDLVNELGRRLDYEVINGLYQGTVNQVGFDGLWHSPEGHSPVVEVKTTDAYRISLDKIAQYRRKLSEAGKLAKSSSVLIVVGRHDTGELEAQIRGSQHAWDIRLISVDALIKLVLLKENTEAVETGLQIRSILTPIEYTRLDRVIDVMFKTVADVEEIDGPAAGADANFPEGEIAQFSSVEKGTWQFTDSKVLQSRREKIVAALGSREGANLIRKSRALYWNAAHDVRAACAMSKRYTGKNQAPYWYAYHPQWEQFLAESQQSFFVLGCMDLDVAFALPHSEIAALLPYLNTTTKENTYWHIHLVGEPKSLAISLPKKGSSFPLQSFQLTVA